MALTKKNMYGNKPAHELEFSFDDGYVTDIKAVTLLNTYGFKGTFYIVLDHVGKEGFLDWDAIKKLDQEGHTIGSHTMSHPADLKALYEQELHYEVQNSKDLIESVLGHNIAKFCYPRGRFDERVKAVVGRSGYVYARVTGTPGRLDGSDHLAMPGSVQIFPREKYGSLSIVEFAKQTLDRLQKDGGYCNIWGHTNEMEKQNLWPDFETILQYVRAQGL